MAAIYGSQSRAFSGCVVNIFYCTSCRRSQIPSTIRYSSSSRQSKIEDDDEDNGGDETECKTTNVKKLKSSTRTAKSRTMASLINSKPWTNDIESSLSSLSPSLSKTTVLQTLHLIRNPIKAVSFFKWAQDNGFPHTEQNYFLILECLGRSRNLNAARNFLFSIEKISGGTVKLDDKFFNSLIRSYDRAGLFQESIKLFLKMKSIGMSPSTVTFNSLFSILLKRGRTSFAKKLYDEMLSTYGVTPDTYTFNILIRGFSMNSMVDEGFHFFKEISRFKCDPDVVTYNTLVDGLCRAGKVKIAHNVLKGMLKKSLNLNLNPDVVTYTTLIRGYCMKEDIDEALVLLEEMISRGLKPNEITYNTLIQGLSEARKFDKIKDIFDGTLGGVEFIPDTCTFNTLMNAHCNAGKVNEALKVFEKMLCLKVQPDSASYSVLIRSLCKRRDFQRAEELFDELSEKEILVSDNGCTPLVAAYKSMFEYLCENGKTKKAETLFRQLLKRGTQDPPSYKTLIMGHCREGTFEAGYDLLVLMLRRDFDPDVEIYESVIDGLLLKGDPLLAHKTLEKMLKSSLRPKTPTVHSLLAELLKKDCASESASLILLMLEKRIRPNIKFSTDAIKLLFCRGLNDKAFEIIGLLYENEFSIEMEEFLGFLCQRGKLLEAHKILLFSLEKRQNFSIDICSRVISGLCKTHKLSEAFGLYFELVEKGLQEKLSCLEDLKIALEAEGRLSEADFVYKRMLKQGQSDISASKHGTKVPRPCCQSKVLYTS